MARKRSLDDIEKRIEALKQEKYALINDMALNFARRLITEQKLNSKMELNDWYKKAKDAIKFKDDFDARATAKKPTAQKATPPKTGGKQKPKNNTTDDILQSIGINKI